MSNINTSRILMAEWLMLNNFHSKINTIIPPLRSGGGGIRTAVARRGRMTEGDKSNPNPILTFNCHTAGTPLPTAENNIATAGGKNSHQLFTNSNQTKSWSKMRHSFSLRSSCWKVSTATQTEGDKSKPNPMPTLSVATTGTCLPTVENIVHPRDGKILDKSNPNDFPTTAPKPYTHHSLLITHHFESDI